MSAVLRIAVLITCFNRQQKTLQCLQMLASQLHFSVQCSVQCSVHSSHDNQPAVAAECTVYLLDNGNDGTFAAVAAQFPWVQLSRGHADLYWNSGMRRVWLQALSHSATTPPFDFYLWLNDDVSLAPDAIYRLLQNYLRSTPTAGALIGSMAAPSSATTASATSGSNQQPVPSYGGRQRKSRLNPLAFGPVMLPTPQPQLCTFINGNLCLIPQAAVQKIGVLSEHFSHGLGDFDYGLRLQQAGFATYVAPGFYGECAVNPKIGSVFDETLPLAQRLLMMQRPNVLPPDAEWRYFVRCHGGWVWPLLWLKSWGRQLFPALWLRLRQRRAA
ncbi:hypothetical protein A5320_10940 [Rheinheimera sp. SA_1]|uniref:glycosyltransferase family 2 protein n=1 Tax=Rheinheimera sp. SA_1 TaxID=1827365 RepID=UPI0007FC4B8D|nr:glycosyltransferase [Rheinheimera sp. SA_1]OBP14300.1 hypothetical protein A5320_10940 [Rheinheimera sp. SA_1]